MAAKSFYRSSKAGSGLQLTPAQQRPLWAMLEAAWREVIRAEGRSGEEASAAAKEIWRKEYLGATLGLRSLKDIPKGGPMYRRVMGALQEVARNGIDWIIKADRSTPLELVHHARAVLARHEIAEDYACGVARNALQLSVKPESLDMLTAAQLGVVIRILHGQAARIATAAKKEGVPF